MRKLENTNRYTTLIRFQTAPRYEMMDGKTPLRARFEQFILGLPGVESIDKLLEGRPGLADERADYVNLASGLVIEQKSLETDTRQKVDHILQPFKELEEFPHFFGGWDLKAILDYLPEPEKIHAKIINSVTTSIRANFRKADRQIAFTKEIFGIPNGEGLLVVLNDSIELLTPELIQFTLQKISTSSTETGELRYRNVQGALIISEAHGAHLSGGVLAHPTLFLQFAQELSPTFIKFVEQLFASWTMYCGAAPIDAQENFEEFDFVGMSTLAEKQRVEMPRHEAWRRYYRANRYWKRFTNAELKSVFRMIFVEVGRGLIKGASDIERERSKYFWMEAFTHFMEEANARHIDIRYFTYDEATVRELDAIMEGRFPDFQVPDRSGRSKFKPPRDDERG